jgi:hypothetical protein
MSADKHTPGPKLWDVFFDGDCAANSIEAYTAEAACDDYAKWASNQCAHTYRVWRSRINAGVLVARPAKEDHRHAPEGVESKMAAVRRALDDQLDPDYRLPRKIGGAS